MFDPWVGPKWGEQGNHFGGLRVLVLGESHYSDSDEIGSIPVGLTKRVVGEYLRNPCWRFFTNTTQALTGRSKSELGKRGIEAVWDSICFYNYVPAIAADAPRKAPPAHLWSGGEQCFLQVLGALDVECVVALGWRLWSHMPAGDQPSTRLGGMEECRVYPGRKGRLIFSTAIRHPSSIGFRYQEWHPIVALLLEHARVQRG